MASKQKDRDRSERITLMQYCLLSKSSDKKAITTARITVVIVCLTCTLFYQDAGVEIAPVNVLRPVYDPASVIVPGTRIPQ